MGLVLNVFISTMSAALHCLCGVGTCCRFTPSCSEYAREAVRVHGVGRGFFITIGRLIRCRPGSAFGVDPVPQRTRN